MAAVLLVTLIFAFGESIENPRPFIGIPVMKVTDELLLRTIPNLQDKSYIAASYVKFIEFAGARIVPITPELLEEDLKMLFQSISGLLFPGGEINLENSGYFKLTRKLYKMAVRENERNNNFPILGICRGMQALIVHQMEGLESLVSTNSVNYTTSLSWSDKARNSSLFKDLPEQLWEDTAKLNITSHFHKYGIQPKTLEHMLSYEILATSVDKDAKEFVSIIQGRKLPFYGVQFHPEKPMFEWADTLNIPHSSNAIRFGQSIANGFLDKARKNQRMFKSVELEQKFTIARYPPVFTGYLTESHSPFVQIYVFK